MRWWLLLLYKIPTEPSAGRVFAWRKLKRLGAILLNDATWVLPLTPWTKEQLQWLAAEIREHGGEAAVWEAHLADGEDQALVDQFQAPVDAAYAEILADLRGDDADLASISRRYQQEKAQDYFHSSLGETIREALLEPKKGGSS